MSWLLIIYRRPQSSQSISTVESISVWSQFCGSHGRFDFLTCEAEAYSIILWTPNLDSNKSKKLHYLPIKSLKNIVKYWKKYKIQPQTSPDSLHQPQIIWDLGCSYAPDLKVLWWVGVHKWVIPQINYVDNLLCGQKLIVFSYKLKR